MRPYAWATAYLIPIVGSALYIAYLFVVAAGEAL